MQYAPNVLFYDTVFRRNFASSIINNRSVTMMSAEKRLHIQPPQLHTGRKQTNENGFEACRI